MTAPARTAAFHALLAIARERMDLPVALADTRSRLADERDRGLTSAIVTGTLRWQRAMDHLIEHFSRRTIAKLDEAVVIILRLSLFQLLHFDRVPAAAVVDDAVNLTRAARKPSASGFVNAVLRAFLRQRHRPPWPARPHDPGDRAAAIAYLGVTHSHPDWLVARWLDRLGFDATETWVTFNNATAPLTIRANTLQTSRQRLHDDLAALNVDTRATRFAPDGLTVESGNPLQTSARGHFVVQDESSQLVPLTLDARPGERVLDLCASPGGKTLAIASAMEGSGVIVASDVRPARVALLHHTVREGRASRVHVLQVPAAGPLPFHAAFDRVLVDAPCSGLGTIRRDPDIKWRRTEEDLHDLARQQVDLLIRAATTVRPGGRLVYATCSSEPEENEAVVDQFLARAPFELVNLRVAGLDVLRPLIDDRGMLHTSPSTHGLEAFFAAALVRGNSCGTMSD